MVFGVDDVFVSLLIPTLVGTGADIFSSIRSRKREKRAKADQALTEYRRSTAAVNRDVKDLRSDMILRSAVGGVAFTSKPFLDAVARKGVSSIQRKYKY